MEEIDYLNIVTNSWSTELRGRSMYVIWEKLKRLQTLMRRLIIQTIVGVQNIQENIVMLLQVEQELEVDMFNQECIERVKTLVRCNSKSN